MTNTEKTVFISYRRSVSKYIARSIFQDLRYHDYDVFLDIETINSGTFDTIILDQIAARAHFLVILTVGTLDRCVESGDWLRREIEVALDLQRNIVPILVDDFDFSTVGQYLMDKLSELPRYNSLHLHYDYFDDAMNRLRNRFLMQPISGSIKSISPEQQREVDQIIEETTNEPTPTREELNAETLFIRTLAKQEIGDFDGAIADYTEVIRLDPQNSSGYVGRGFMRCAKGDLDGAISDYTEAIHLAPDNIIMVYQRRGEAYFVLGQYENARRDFTKAREQAPSFPEYLMAQAVAIHASGQMQKAIKLWKSLAEQDRRYEDANWVEQKVEWPEPMMEEARKLIASL